MEWYEWDYEKETLEDCQARRTRCCPRLTATQLEALWQLRMTVWDGYLTSKTARDALENMRLVVCYAGWQVVTREGLAVLDMYGLLKDDRYGTQGDAGRRLWKLGPEDFARLRGEGLLHG